MKKAIVLLGLTSAMSAFTGCSKDEPTSPETVGVQEYTINSIIAGGDTRTALDTETLQLSWLKGDKIKVYTGDNGIFTEYTTENGDGMFKGSVKPVLSSSLSYVAVYPDGKFGTVVDGTKPIEALRITVPKDQKYEAGKGPVGAIPMVGIWGDGDESVLFKPVGSALRLPVYSAVEGTTLTSVAFQFQSSSAGNVGAGEIGLKSWALDEYGDYSSPEVYYKRTDFAYGEVTPQVTVTGDIALGTTAETATDVYVAVTPGNYQGGYTVTITDAEGASMSKTKPASSSIVALMAGRIQKIAPLEYVQKAPKFTVAENPSDNTVVTATLDAEQELLPNATYQYWVEALSGGMQGSRWSQASDKIKLSSGTTSIVVSDIELSKLFSQPKEGDKLRFVVEASESGTVYTRSYEYTYHKAVSGEVKIDRIDYIEGNVEIFFSAGEELLKNAEPSNVLFNLSSEEWTASPSDVWLSDAGDVVKWNNDTDGFGVRLVIPLSAFGADIPVGTYTLTVSVFESASDFDPYTSSSAEFDVYNG